MVIKGMLSDGTSCSDFDKCLGICWRTDRDTVDGETLELKISKLGVWLSAEAGQRNVVNGRVQL
eukprot:766579-Hanusia_phi.AAC.1